MTPRAARRFLGSLLLGAAALLPFTGSPRALAGPAPPDAIHWNERGLALSGEGRLLEAVEAFRKANKAAPDDRTIRRNLALARSNLAVALIKVGNLDAAAGHAQQAHELDPSDPVIALNLAAVYGEQGYPDKAAEVVRLARELGPGLASVRERMGSVHYREGRLDEAVAEWEKALEIRPENPALSKRLQRAKASLRLEATLTSQLSSHFEILHDSQSAVLASLILRELEEAYDVVGADLQNRIDRPLKIVLLSTEQFQAATGAHTWVAGLFDGQIRLPVKGATQKKAGMLARARHEYVHAALAPLGKRAPSWLHEGLAQTHERASAAAARQRVSREPALAFGQLSLSFAGTKDAARARLQYDTALAFVHWLRTAERGSAFRLAMKRLFDGAQLADGFEEAYGAPLAKLYDRFQQSVRK